MSCRSAGYLPFFRLITGNDSFLFNYYGRWGFDGAQWAENFIENVLFDMRVVE